MTLKIAMIGAGSVGFTRRLMTDLLAVPEFADTHFALMDISERSPGVVAQAQWLPNYSRSDIDAAALRLAGHEAAGTRVQLQQTQGAARLQTRSVEELRAAG